MRSGRLCLTAARKRCLTSVVRTEVEPLWEPEARSYCKNYDLLVLYPHVRNWKRYRMNVSVYQYQYVRVVLQVVARIGSFFLIGGGLEHLSVHNLRFTATFHAGKRERTQ
jgi:hypothetical protein